MSAIIDRLKADYRAVAEELRTLAKSASGAGRDFTDEEKAKAVALQAKLDGLRRDIELRTADEKLAKALGNIGEPMAAPGASGGMTDYMPAASGSKWARQVAGRLIAAADRYGVKALTSGSIDVPAIVEPIVTLPARPTRVLDLIPRRPLTANSYEYLRQTVRTNNAGPVADGEQKPTSVYTVEPVEERARVFAHLSEPIPERYFVDHADLVQLIDTQMREDALIAIETQIISGDGVGENLTGIMNTSGVVSVPFSSDALTTIRKARTALESTFQTPTAWVFNPTDLETIDLMREDGTTGAYLVNTSSLENVFGPWPRISTPAVPAGTAILADWTTARLRVREQMRLDADRSGENFQKNLVTLRVEGRFAFDITRPAAFAVVDLTSS